MGVFTVLIQYPRLASNRAFELIKRDSRGFKVFQAEMKHLYVDEGMVFADARNIIEIGASQVQGIRKEPHQVSDFSYTIMRKDPPVDSDYIKR